MRNLNRLQYLILVVGIAVVLSSCLAVQEKGGETTSSSVNQSQREGALSSSMVVQEEGGETTSSSDNQSPKGKDFEKRPVPGEREVLVKFKASVSQEEIQHILKKHSIILKEVIPEIDWYVLKIPGDRPVAELIEELKQEQQVEAVESQGSMGILRKRLNQEEKR